MELCCIGILCLFVLMFALLGAASVVGGNQVSESVQPVRAAENPRPASKKNGENK